MTPTPLVVTNTDASVIGSIATPFATLGRAVLLLLSFLSSVSVPASELVFNITTESDGGVYSEITATKRDLSATMHRSMGNITLRTLSIYEVSISRGALR